MDHTDHYYSSTPASATSPIRIEVSVRGRDLSLESDSGVFSGRRLDKGTALLIARAQLPPEGAVLDLGCGYGVVGIVAALENPGARVTLVDVNERAADLARRNCEAYRLTKTEVLTGEAALVLGDRAFDAIVCNPPYRMGKQAIMATLGDAAARLRPGGSLWIVGRTKQGIKTLARDLSGLFAQTTTVDIKGGYRVIRLQVS